MGAAYLDQVRERYRPRTEKPDQGRRNPAKDLETRRRWRAKNRERFTGANEKAVKVYMFGLDSLLLK